MNKKELIKIIELVVRKEVKKQMTEIFINDKEEIKLSETISKPKPKKVVNKPKKQSSKIIVELRRTIKCSAPQDLKHRQEKEPAKLRCRSTPRYPL